MGLGPSWHHHQRPAEGPVASAESPETPRNRLFQEENQRDHAQTLREETSFKIYIAQGAAFFKSRKLNWSPAVGICSARRRIQLKD